MKYFDKGSLFTVTVFEIEVIDFAMEWPCSGLESRGVTFTFDKDNGDLVDSNDAKNHPHADGGAILALAEDAEAYGREQIARRKRA